jgi:micrococcal nuclease
LITIKNRTRSVRLFARLGVFVVWLSAIDPVLALDRIGSIKRVIDGDTVIFQSIGEEKVTVRLSEIDAPEIGQFFGKKSKAHLESLVLGEQVKISIEGTDRYGRQIGIIWRQNTNINHQMVRDGFAWVYRRYSNSEELIEAETTAKSLRAGLWQRESPINPSDWRSGSRSAITTKITNSETVKKSRSGICHAPGTIYYSRTITFEAFENVKLCLESGGRLPKR